MKKPSVSSINTIIGIVLTILILLAVNFQFSSGSRESLPSGFEPLTAKNLAIQVNFTSIQKSINEAEDGSTIVIPPGTYYERIVINKTITLIGENASATIIDGSGAGTIVCIIASNVTITGFTVQHSGWGWYKNGIYVHKADNCRIEGNILINNCHNIRLNFSENSQIINNSIAGDGYGIRLINAYNCTAFDNEVSDCIGGVHLENATKCKVKRNLFTQNSQGIRLYSPCEHNRIMSNVVFNNTYDGMIERMPGNTAFVENYIFHNNFIDNTYPFIYKVSGTIWDDGYPSGGNYWSRLNETDLYRGPFQNETGSDGIIDNPYSINMYDADRYPLAKPWSFFQVHNINTGLGYNSIQEGIDADETSTGHVLWINSGLYKEHLIVNKSLTLLGEENKETIVDGSAQGTVLTITANNVTISGLTIRNSGSHFPPYGNDCGILMDHNSGGTISHNIMTQNRIGLYLLFSTSNTIESNFVANNRENGIWLWYSGDNFLTQNVLSSNSYNFGVFGGSLLDFDNVITTSNTVENRQIIYRKNVEDELFDNQSNIGTLYLINCNNVAVQNLNLSKNGHGIFCFQVENSEIRNVTVLENNYGIYLQDSSNNRVESTYCSKNWVGISLQDSTNNSVVSCHAEQCEKGASLYGAYQNNLSSNTFLNNLYGVRLYSSHSNKLFHNNFIGNNEHVSSYYSYQDSWSNGFEGNYWDNYNGLDSNRDGLGDIPEIVDGGDVDQYPLHGVFSTFLLNFGEVYHIDVISNSTIVGAFFENTSHTIHMTVQGEDNSYGFCRVAVPHVLVEPEIEVVINDGLTNVLFPNYTLRDDGSRRWIYFAYQHSTDEIVIISELTYPAALVILVFAVCLGMLHRDNFGSRKRKRSQR